MPTGIGDAQDYIGGKPTPGYVMAVDAGGRWTQIAAPSVAGLQAAVDSIASTNVRVTAAINSIASTNVDVAAAVNSIASTRINLANISAIVDAQKSTPIFVGLKVSNVFSTTVDSIGYFTLPPIGQRLNIATFGSVTSVDGADSLAVAAIVNSLALSFNSLNLYFQQFGFEAST